MKSYSTPNINTLIIEARTGGKPDMFVPTIIVSKDESKLVDRMTESFTSKLNRLELTDGVFIREAYIDTTCARIDYYFPNKNRSIHWTICQSELI